MIVFVKLLLAHLIGDFILQPTSWVTDKENKNHKSTYLYLHIFLHFILAWILVGELAFGWFALALAVLHGFIDFLKLHYQNAKTKRNWFSIDQLLHLAVLICISLMYTKTEIHFTNISSQLWGLY